jgi:hypothetical protein
MASPIEPIEEALRRGAQSGRALGLALEIVLAPKARRQARARRGGAKRR